MPNPYFSFKQFTVYHDRCAMKVGTDGVLLGAWADVVSARNILDIGTGTGLISLMMAQRCNAQIRAVDIDADAVEQARGNVAASQLQDICHFTSETLFDVIVSNPPYFTDSLKCPERQRNIARHTDLLDFDKLAESAARLLHSEGVFSVIIPADGKESFLMAATRYGLHLSHQTFIHTKPGSEPKRVLLAFKFSVDKCVTDDLTIELSRHVYSFLDRRRNKLLLSSNKWLCRKAKVSALGFMPLNISDICCKRLKGSFSFFLSETMMLSPCGINSTSISFPPMIGSPS